MFANAAAQIFDPDTGEEAFDIIIEHAKCEQVSMSSMLDSGPIAAKSPNQIFNLLTEVFYADMAFPDQLIVAIRNCHSQLSFGLS
jgi:hypothetical protein